MHSVLVATPSCRDPKWDYVTSLLGMVFAMSDGPPLQLTHHPLRSALVTDARTQLVYAAQRMAATHILWLDDDMAWPSDILARLLKHDLPIVAANCTNRAMPVRATARTGGLVVSSAGKHGLEEVDGVGMAVMLTETKIFSELPEPWFATGYDPKRPGPSVTEDVFFCALARKHGLKIMIDHDLSQHVGHVGEMMFHHGMTQRHVEAAE